MTAMSDPSVTLVNERYVAEALARRRRRLGSDAEKASRRTETVSTNALLAPSERKLLAGIVLDLVEQNTFTYVDDRRREALRGDLLELFEEPVEVEIEVRPTLADRVRALAARLRGRPA